MHILLKHVTGIEFRNDSICFIKQCGFVALAFDALPLFSSKFNMDLQDLRIIA